ncbi:DUF2313 domain-containing protein [Clostridium botulinum]|nr:DUF2313 domain-containing protein [Clostridium botulinum]NFR13690.1 DUF2313 domain-containing protein [Clostridium botulinum]NFR42243.1 DUF2313 domain-containing protein [Clostridium botulinum]NFS50683.1 DUF2313 domain-containing protein [Clostridium botulinum]
MDREIDISNYVPKILQEFKEFKTIANTENPEIKLLWKALKDAFNDQFVNDATGNGIKRWESILKIIPKGTDSLDFRKFRIITRLNERLPYTYRLLEQQLTTLCGKDGYYLELKNKEYTLIVKIALTAKSNFYDVVDLLERTVPANIVIDLSLLYNQQLTLSKYTHKELSAYTHNKLRNEVLR